MPNTYNFPFIGISHFALPTSCQILIKFYSEPNDQQKNKIISSAPSVIGLHLANFHWQLIDILKHGIAQKIENNYGKGGQGLILLQQEIETWLNAVHEYCPIEIALQPDYYDEFENEPNAWHEQSIIMVIPILEKWLSEPEELYRSHDSDFSHLCIFVKEITSYLDQEQHQTLIDKSLKIYHPKAYTLKLIEKREINKLLHLINERQKDTDYLLQVMDALSEHIEEVFNIDSETECCIFQLTKYLVNPEVNQTDKKYLIKILTTAIHIGIEREDSEFMRGIQNLLKFLPTKKVILNNLAYTTYSRYVQSKKWLNALLHYEFILLLLENEKLNDNDYSIYCNALYVLQNDITGFGVQSERNRKLLSICLPFAKFNPAIYFNAATLYVEMGEYDEALTNFKEYFLSEDKDKATLYQGLMTEKMYEGFRKHKNTKAFLKKVKQDFINS